MQHLDPHSQAFFRDQPDGHGEDVEFLTREMQMASLVCVKALPMTLVCGAFESTNMSSHRSSCHVDVKPHVTRLEIMAKRFIKTVARCSTVCGALKIQRHHSTAQTFRDEK